MSDTTMPRVWLLVETINTRVMIATEGGVREEVDKILYARLATPVLDTLRYTHAFQKGMSDGREHVYNVMSHSFHSGLLQMVVTILELEFYDVRVIDNRLPRKTGDIAMDLSVDYKLREYQKDALFHAVDRNGILQLPTGAGKTVIAGALIWSVKQPTCFIVHTRTLLYQTQRELSKILNVKVGIIGDSLCEIEDINVCSIQTLYQVLSAHYSGGHQVVYNDKTNKFDIESIRYDQEKIDLIMDTIQRTQHVIFDEAHHIAAETFTEVARAFVNAAWRYGLTATAWREDKKEIMLNQLLGGIIYQVTLEKLIKLGYLVPPRIEILDMVGHDGGRGGRYSKKKEKEYFAGNRFRNELILKAVIKAKYDGFSGILIITRLVDHAKILHAMIYNANMAVDIVTGSVSSEDRLERIKKFESGETEIMVATDIFGEGFDLPRIDCVIMAQMGKSTTKVYQYIGRALRPHVGKDHARIVDIADRFRWFGSWFDARMGVYAIEPVFREGIVDPKWQTRVDLIGRAVDKGEGRIYLDTQSRST